MTKVYYRTVFVYDILEDKFVPKFIVLYVHTIEILLCTKIAYCNPLRLK